MSDWIHCNRCTTLLKDAKNSGLVFFLTNCGHILCAKCTSVISANTCPICQAACNTLELNARIGPEIQVFFSEPVQMLKKNHKTEVQVLEFQVQQMKRLLSSQQQDRASRIDSGERKLQEQKAEYDLKYRQQQEDNRKLVHEVGLLRAEITRLRSNTRTPDTPYFPPHTPPTKQSVCTPSTPNQGFYTPLARSPSPMESPVGQVLTPPGPMRYTLRTTASSQTVRSSQSISPSSPVSSQRIYFPTSSQRTHRVTPMLTPGITSLLQGPDSRTPPAYRNPIGHNVAKSGNRWTQQVYSQNTHLRNPLQITSTRGITSKLH
eukprot:TRINITY_DN4428_c2_g1_i1.p1 TRINITY_DN4428_c2_g1~~TRINITY_DN4428_c2_g1_i1.p1  ORF type:complete len:319 (-),score=63.19 TRINITY_DN4428_c2_g1_i1:29-985(-)